jgi:hypothetical protein
MHHYSEEMIPRVSNPIAIYYNPGKKNPQWNIFNTVTVCITLNWILYGIARLQYSTVPYCISAA